MDFFVISQYGRLATTEDSIAPVLTRASDIVDRRKEARIIKGLYKKY